MIYLLIAILILPPAILLIHRGVRGRKIDDHPLCAKCGFDLFGRPLQSKVCSECGAELGNDARRIRFGHRERKPWLIAAGLALLLPSGISIALGVQDFSDSAPIERHLPFRVLLNEIHWKNSNHAFAAYSELMTRYDSRTLDRGQVARLVADQLRLASPLVPSEFLDRARANGDISDSEWDAYLRKYSVSGLKVRPQVRRGDPIPIEVIAGNNLPDVSYDFFVKSLDIDGIACNSCGIKGGGTNFGMSHDIFEGMAFHEIDLPPEDLAQLGDGMHTMHITISLRVSFLTSFEINFEPAAQFTLLPADKSSVRLVSPPELASAMSAAYSGATIHRASGGFLVVDFPFNKPPKDFIGDYFLRSGNQEWNIGRTDVWPLDEGVQIGGVIALPDFYATQADIILRPNPEYALHTIWATEIWGKEIVIPNVPVK